MSSNSDFVTVGIFSELLLADMAKNHLEAEGIPCFIENAHMGSLWHLNTAMGGIKLQVREQDADRALALLESRAPISEEADLPEDKQIGEETTSQAEVVQEFPGEVPPTVQQEPVHSSNEILTNQDELANRAFRGAIFGLILIFLQPVVFWLLIKLWISEQPLSVKGKWEAKVATIINLPMMFIICLLLRRIIQDYTQ